ncbi:polyphosphate kinase 1 [Ktedonospora formicarum]|uniref:Polyphosphate kinase n=1 Tax=Ktedonospora formicarum TaxID=2778364 RepID=A0A8J3MQP2_9CHLR|nr:polyphosphate kinase 1 [Ktedonospora formicarum]GHO44170.1 polyphosphate kinase [Ktedonospora formicarum]
MSQTTSSASNSPDTIQPDLYINRELSWVEFNRRVFEEAKDTRHPLLERVKFISIFENNLDEFIMIRLAGLKDQIASRAAPRSPDGRTAAQQLAEVRRKLAPLVQEVRQYWRHTLLPLLADQHIHILDYEQLDEPQRENLRAYFEREVFPVLTPLAVDSVHPFPHISNLSLNLAVVLTDALHEEELFARVKIPPTLPRLVPVPLTIDGPEQTEQPYAVFVWMEQLIAAHLSMLFPGFDVWESYPFRVLRDADIELQEDDASDLIEVIEQEVRERRFGMVVDLAVNPAMPQRIRQLLIDNLEITPNDVSTIDGTLGMGDVIELRNLDRPELKDISFTPRIPGFVRRGPDLFTTIRNHDVLLHHPYDSFSTVVDFINAAADDRDVLAIKQTLYRVGPNSPVVQALLRAAENGKQVAVLVELKARFDEENNIVWARELERAGVHVVYGLKGLKTHSKLALVVRKEGQSLRRYVHLGTGNYNATTARIYEDLGLFTSHPEICDDATMLFNSLTGYSRQYRYRQLLVAPLGLRRHFVELIEREIRLHGEFGNGRLIFKFNSLTDPEMIQRLYKASQAGVQIDLIIRGICCLRPNLPGISENIRVRSLVGRFLEHSRIYYFGNNGNPEVLVGSADLMQRNLNNRVEVLFPIERHYMRDAVYENLLCPILADNVNAHILDADGTYKHVQIQNDAQPMDSQSWFINHPLFDLADEDEGPDQTISAIPSSV